LINNLGIIAKYANLRWNSGNRKDLMDLDKKELKYLKMGLIFLLSLKDAGTFLNRNYLEFSI